MKPPSRSTSSAAPIAAQSPPPTRPTDWRCGRCRRSSRPATCGLGRAQRSNASTPAIPQSTARAPRRWGLVIGPWRRSGARPRHRDRRPGPARRQHRNPGQIARASGNGGPAGSSVPAVTPLTVPTSDVTWVVTKSTGGLSIVTAHLDKVCPTGDEPDCAPLAGLSQSIASLPTVPSSLVRSPSNAAQAVAIGPAPDNDGTTLFVMAVPVAASSPAPSSSAPASVAASRDPSRRARARHGAPARLRRRRRRAPHRRCARPDPRARAPAAPSPTPVVSPPPSGTPAPTAAATLAILSNVTLVGDQAAYSADGQWFAFSAQPAGTTTGPDIYVWQGRLARRPADHHRSRHGLLGLGRWPDPCQPGGSRSRRPASGAPAASGTPDTSPPRVRQVPPSHRRRRRLQQRCFAESDEQRRGRRGAARAHFIGSLGRGFGRARRARHAGRVPGRSGHRQCHPDRGS